MTNCHAQNLQPSLRGVQISSKTRHLTLWTERGAARHAKMLDTDQAWEVFEKLEDCYFTKKPAEQLVLPNGQHYVVAKDGVVLMHKVLSHDINDSFLKSLAQPTLDLQGLELLQGEIDYWQVRKALALVNGLVGQYQPYSHVRPMVNVLEATENMLRRLWTMIDESSIKVGILQAVAKTGKPLNEANRDTLAHTQALLSGNMMKLQMPQL